ncbi:phosphodiesterase, partial [Candidatus Woesearchaeota archaeon CG_4_10_14_0_2_um_filter_57_5]
PWMRPDYSRSIVNIMASISRALGRKHPYASLPELEQALRRGRPWKTKGPRAQGQRRKRNIVLVVLDGMGYEFLCQHRNSYLYQHCIGKVTSVFPSTTGACIPTFATGLPPQQHGLTGWFMHEKTMGGVITTLPFTYRSGEPLPFIINDAYGLRAFAKGLRAEAVQPASIAHTAFSMACYPHRRAYTTLEGFVRQTAAASRRARYTYAYWPYLDTIGHARGIGSRDALTHFSMLDAAMQELARRTQATIIITADHGMLDTPPGHRIALKDHPSLESCLTLPLCAEARAAFCYVRPAKVAAFKAYVRKRLAHACTMRSGESLIAQGYFGRGRPHPRLRDHVGDFVLLMKEDYILRDALLGQEPAVLIGNHGGVSPAEMLVPVIVANG